MKETELGGKKRQRMTKIGKRLRVRYREMEMIQKKVVKESNHTSTF